jgi:hypothetical protein
MKFLSVKLRVAAVLIAILVICVVLPVITAQAAISLQQPWTAVYTGAGFPGTYPYTVNAGANRMLVVAVSSSLSASPGAIQSATVTYGGVSLTQQVGDGGTQSITHTYLFYLQDAPAVMDGAAHNLVVAVTGGTTRWNYVYAAVYAGVDQSASPITNSRNYNSLAAQPNGAVGFATALTIGNGDQAVEIINLTRTTAPVRTITGWATNWSSAIGPNSSAAFTSAYVATNNTPGTTTAAHTASGTCYRSMSAMSIKSFTAIKQTWSNVYAGAAYPGSYNYTVNPGTNRMLVVAVASTRSAAAITQPQAWSNVYNNANYPAAPMSYTVNAGSNRMLVVAVSSTRSTAGPQTITVTYGGRSLTKAVGDDAVSARAHTYLFYLLDTPAVMNGSAQSLVVNIAGGTSSRNYVYAAVYAGVDQSANPITSSQNFNSLGAVQTAVGPFATPLTIGSGDQAVEVINLISSSPTARTISGFATGWTSAITTANNPYRAYVARSSTAGNTTSLHTASGTALSSMSAMSIKAAPATQTITVTYGGQSLTKAVGDDTVSSRTHTYLFYLLDTPAVMNGSPQNLVVSITGGTSSYNYVYAAVYAGVDQSANPITSSRNFNSLGVPQTPVGPFASVLTIGGDDMAVEVINLLSSSATAQTISTWALGWSSTITNATNPYRAYIAANGTAGDTTSQHTASATVFSSMSAMSIKPLRATPTPPATNTPTQTHTSTFTPTFTPTPTRTFTPTFTPIPLGGATALRFSALLLNAPDFGLAAQTIGGKVQGGGGPPYTVLIYIEDPDGDVATYAQNVELDGTFELTPGEAGDPFLGCSKEGIWEAWFVVTDGLGGTATSNRLSWTVNFPRTHGIP